MGVEWKKKSIQNPQISQSQFLSIDFFPHHFLSFLLFYPLIYKMGKNQAYKAMQRARLGSSSGGPEEVEDGMVCTLSYHPILNYATIQ